jgi:hypothetical protein
MHGVDGARLKRAKQFAGRNDLVGVVEFDLQLALGGSIDRVDDRLGDVLAERRTGIGLETPLDSGLRLDDGRRRKRYGTGGPDCRGARPGKKLPSVGHISIPLVIVCFSAGNGRSSRSVNGLFF